jgi:PleD family two-component response regulator
MADPASCRPRLALIANDQEWSMRSLESILAPSGYAFLRAYTGKQAIELACETTPDLIVVDVDLPDLTGIEVCRTLSDDPRISSNTPLIISTARHLQRGQRLEAVKAGVWDFLCWPIDAEEVLARLDIYVRAKLDADRSREESMVDQVTGLYNLRGLMRRVRELGSDAFRDSRALACVALAPERPADVEDAAGEGDPALWETVNRLGRVFVSQGRVSDAIGRVRLCEFVVFAPATDEAGARRLAQRLLSAIEEASAEEAGDAPAVKILAGYDAVPNFREAGMQAASLLAGATSALHRLQAEPGTERIAGYDGDRESTLPLQ